MLVLLALVYRNRLVRTVVVTDDEAIHYMSAGWQFVAFDPETPK